MAFRRPGRVNRSLDLEPVNRHAWPDMLRRPTRHLTDAQTVPWNRNGIEDDALASVEPLRDLCHLRLHRGSGEGPQQSPAFLLLAFLMSPQHRGLGCRAGLRLALIPVKTPEREFHAIETRVDRRHIHRRLVTREIGIERSHRALALRGDQGGELRFALLQIRPRIAHVPGLVLESTAHREGGIRLLVFQEHELPLDEIASELEQTRRVDAPLEDPWRLRLLRDGGVERFFHRRLVGLEMGRGNVERPRDLLVASDPSVGREHREEVEPRQGEEILEGVLELRARHAAQADSAAFGEARLVRDGELLIEPTHHFCRRPGVGPRFLFRRHLAPGDGVVDFHPGGEGFRVRELRLQRREIEPAFFHLGIVAFDAVLIEERDGIRDERGREKEKKGGKKRTHCEVCPLPTNRHGKTRPGMCHCGSRRWTLDIR